MPDWLGSFLTAIRKIAPVPLLAIAIAAGVLLIMTESQTAILGIQDIRSQYRGWFGAAFIFSAAYLVAYGLWWMKDSAVAWRKKSKGQKIGRNYLRNLSASEKAYLVPYVIEGRTTQYFAMEDGVVGALLGKHIIYRASNLGSLVDGWAYNIQPWALEHLAKHPDLLAGAGEPPRRPRDRLFDW